MDDISSTATQTDESAMMVGKIRQPDGLLTAFNKVRNANAVPVAVLLVFTQTLKGRLCIRGNRLIIGAAIEGTDEVGLAAAEKILAIEHGMFGFRPILTTEAAPLAQGLAIDIERIVARGTCKLVADDIETPEQVAEEAETEAAAPAQTTREEDEVNPAYVEWLQNQQDKVAADIEQSLNRGQSESIVEAAPTQSVQETQEQQEQQKQNEDLQLLNDMLRSEKRAVETHQRMVALKWRGLDEIPTPSGQVQSSTKIASAAGIKKAAAATAAAEAASSTGDGGDDDAEAKAKEELNELVRRRQMRLALAVGAIAFVCTAVNFFMSSNDVNKLFHDAKIRYDNKQYKESEFLLQQALMKDPNNAVVHMQLGLTEAKLGKLDDALKEFDAVLANGGNRVNALLARATILCEKQQFDQAIAECRTLLLKDPTSVDAYRILATAYNQRNEAENAVASASSALKYTNEKTVKSALLLERGYGLSHLGKADQAEADFTEAIALNPTSAMYMARGDAYKKLGKYAEAVADYTQVLDKSPNYNAYVARGIARSKNGQDKEALADFGAALKLEKHGVEALIQRGSLYLSQGAYQLAINDLHDAATLNPTIAECQQKLDAAYKQIRGTRAQVALKIDEEDTVAPTTKFKMPDDPKELLKVGYKYLNNGEVDHATMCFAAAVRKDPNNTQARRYLAHAFFESGNAPAAANQFETLAKIGSLDPSDILPMAKSNARSGKNDRAVQILETYLQRDPAYTPYREELFNIYVSTNQIPKAKQVASTGMALPSASQSDRQHMQQLLASLTRPASGPSGTADHDAHGK